MMRSCSISDYTRRECELVHIRREKPGCDTHQQGLAPIASLFLSSETICLARLIGEVPEWQMDNNYNFLMFAWFIDSGRAFQYTLTQHQTGMEPITRPYSM